MGAPSGAVAKLFFQRESTPGTFPTFNATSGVRLYFDQFDCDSPQTPVEIPEIRGSNTYDHVAFTTGAAQARGRIRLPLRYAGVDAMLIGWAMGELITAGSGPAYTHTAKTVDALISASLLHQYPVDTDTAFSENHVMGAKPTRMRISCEVEQPAMLEIDFVAMEIEGTPTDTSPVPPDDNTGYSPYGFNYALWNHHTTITFQRESGSLKSPNLTSYEFVVENATAQTISLGTSRRQSEPFRSGLRNVFARFTMEQDTDHDEIIETFGKLISEAPERIRMDVTMTDPALANTTWVVSLSNGYVLSVGRGTPDQGPQRQQVEIRGHYMAASPYPNTEALRVVLTSPEEGPGATKYGDLI